MTERYLSEDEPQRRHTAWRVGPAEVDPERRGRRAEMAAAIALAKAVYGARVTASATWTTQRATPERVIRMSPVIMGTS